METARILVTGCDGFLLRYVVAELLDGGHRVRGVDNMAAHGPIERPYAEHDGFEFVHADVADPAAMAELLRDCDYLICGAASVGGIGYMARQPFDIWRENEAITLSELDAARVAFQDHGLRRVTVLSSSMVYERARTFPTPEGETAELPPPRAAYAFQKLAKERQAQAVSEQYGLPYTIVRPFNAIGLGPVPSEPTVAVGEPRRADRHVLPDLTLRLLDGESPLRILGTGEQVRQYTHARDLARGIVAATFHAGARNEVFNLAARNSAVSVLELARRIWRRVRSDEPFHFSCEPAFPNDVMRNEGDVTKAERTLGFTAEISLDDALDEIVAALVERRTLGQL